MRGRSAVVITGIAGLLALALLFLPEEKESELITGPAAEPSLADSNLVSVEDTLSWGESLYASLVSKGISSRNVVHVLKALSKWVNLRSCNPGDSYEASVDGAGAVVSLLYRKGLKEIFKVHRDSLEYIVCRDQVPLAGGSRRIDGVLKSSLWESFADVGEDPRLSLKLADVFGWEIDFLTDPRAGDDFTILFEELRYPGGEVEIGDILCSRYVNDGKEFLVFRFPDDEGRPGYYDRDGRSVRREFLKSPLNYRRISSFFSNRRFHPILKIFRPHHGIDYAAPSGTPVVSIGDGRVAYAGWNGGLGRYVEIRHNSVYASCYGHLSGFGKGVKTGARVEQGQVVGYVGSTGLSTGPHLDFRIKKFASYVNPLKIDCPRGEPVNPDRMEEFIQVRDMMLRALGSDRVAATP